MRCRRHFGVGVVSAGVGFLCMLLTGAGYSAFLYGVAARGWAWCGLDLLVCGVGLRWLYGVVWVGVGGAGLRVVCLLVLLPLGAVRGVVV